MEIITVEELAAALRTTIAADNPSALLYVELANDMVSDVIGEDATVTAEIRSITLEAAGRPWINPSKTSSVTKTFDDASRTDRWESTKAQAKGAGLVYLTDEEKAALRAEVGGDKTPGIGTIFVGTRFPIGGC